MKIYLVRHAIAVPHGTAGVPEDDRELTTEGIDKMKKAAAGLRVLGILPDLVLSSPLPRARQTAEILLASLGAQVPLKTVLALSPSGSRPELYEEVRAHRKLRSIMLVGHQPSLGEIAGEIAWGSPECLVELKKGGACCLDVPDLQPNPRGELLWLLTPAILRRIAS
jgi:phosphohistidine phosphatase